MGKATYKQLSELDFQDLYIEQTDDNPYPALTAAVREVFGGMRRLHISWPKPAIVSHRMTHRHS